MDREGNSRQEIKEISKNPLLEGPEAVSPEEERQQEGEMSFSFSSDNRRYHLGHKDGQPFLVVEYFDALPDSLSETEKAKFTKETKEEDGIKRVVFVLRYGEVPTLQEGVGEPGPGQSETYHVAQPRDFERSMMDSFVTIETNKKVISKILAENSTLDAEEITQVVEQLFAATRRHDREAVRALTSNFSKETGEKVLDQVRKAELPKTEKIEVAHLAEVLKSQKVLFYTGAGISIAGGVHNMDQLQRTLGIDMSQETDDLLKKAVINPQGVIDAWEEFTKVAFEQPATAAHQALGELAKKFKAQIFTENIDHLQERAGVKAIHITGPWLKENIQPEWLKDIDTVITVGLSYDDRGFLGWYKDHNPNGKIIAINVNQPSYLGADDLLLVGDCQTVLPEVAAAVKD